MQLPRTFGQYVLLSSLGKGAAGEAFLARPCHRDRGVPTPVVIKVLHQELADDEEFAKRFRHEANVVVQVQGRHLAPTYDVGAVGDSLYFALEYVPGFSGAKLLSLLAKLHVLPPIPIAVGIAVQCLRGLADLWNAKDDAGRPLEIVHRDVSPKNIMVGDDGLVRLIDLGLGKSNAQDWQTRDGRIMGAPGYMAPEQIRGEHADHRADLFSIGIVSHELLTMRRYIKVTSDVVAMMKAGLEKEFVPPSQLRSQIPPAIDEALRTAIAPAREDRFDDASQFADALERAVNPASEEEIAAFLAEALGDEGDQRRADVERALEIGASHELGEERTVVLALRPGVRRAAEERRAWHLPILALTAAAMLLSLAGFLLKPNRVNVLVVDPVPEAPPPPAVSVQPLEEVKEIEPVESRPRSVVREVRRPPPAPRLPPPSKISFEVRLAALDRRVQHMWKQLALDDPRREAVAKLVRDLSMTKNALSRIADPEAELSALERRILALEK